MRGCSRCGSELDLVGFEFSILILFGVDYYAIAYLQILNIRFYAALGNFHLRHEQNCDHFVLRGFDGDAIRSDGFDEARYVFEPSVSQKRSGERERQDGGDDSVCHGGVSP